MGLYTLDSSVRQLGGYCMIHTVLNFVYIAVGVVFLFGAAIFVHEFGHFWVARRRGLKVEAFAIGFGPKIFAWTRDGIEYSVRWIPAGGFVKLPQMITSSAIEGEKKGEDVPPASPLSKILVAVAGPIMNVVFAFFIATVIYYVGLPVPVNPSIVGYVDPASPEGKLGIQKGDRIIAVDGKPVKSWEEVGSSTVLALTNILPVTIQHQDKAGIEGRIDIYPLKADTNNLLGLKTFNLDPLEHLIVGEVVSGDPADVAKIKADDEVIGFAGVPVSSHQQFSDLVQKRGSQPTPIVVMRGGKRLTLSVTPMTDSSSKKSHVGIAWSLGKDEYIIEHPTPLAQVQGDVDQIYKTITALTHSRESGVKASDLSGPVGIFGVLAVEWHTDYRLALKFLVMVNINLAILNMLPVPVLDGGHIMMAVIERVRRRPLGVRFVEYTTTVFALLIISFMLYVTFFDVKRLPLIRMMFNRETHIEQPGKPAATAPATPPQTPQ
jgi:regulator of sigma E protease